MAKRKPKNLPGDPKLRRQRSRRDVRRSVIAYCEGTSTEPRYLDAFTQEFGDTYLVKVEAIGTGNDPLKIVEAAVARKEEESRSARRSKDSLEASFDVWAVFDVDDGVHKTFAQAIALANSKGIACAVSNPCVEIWGLQHFRVSDAPQTRHECQRELEQHMPKYDRRGSKQFDAQLILPSWEIAAERADQLLKNRLAEDNAGGNPSTTIQKLLRSIVAK